MNNYLLFVGFESHCPCAYQFISGKLINALGKALSLNLDWVQIINNEDYSTCFEGTREEAMKKLIEEAANER